MARHTLLSRHIDRISARSNQLATAEQIISNARLIAVIMGALLASFFFASSPAASAVCIVVTIVVFAALVRWHNRVRQRLGRARAWMVIKRTNCARITQDWANIRQPPEFPIVSDHPFETDFDISGARSLHHLLDTTSSRQGSARLRDMLLYPLTSTDAIHARQSLLAELSPLWCDRLALNGGGAAVGERPRDTQRIVDWLESTDLTRVSGRFVALLGALCLLSALLWVLNQLGLLPPLYAFSFGAYAVLSFTKAKAAQSLWSTAMGQHDIYSALSSVFAFLEHTKTAHKPGLHAMLAPFKGDERPSRLLRKLLGVIAAGGLQANPILWMFTNVIMPWDLYHAYRLARLRDEYRQRLPGWLRVWHELEAMAALRIFAHLNPDYVQPTITEGGGLQATQIGHPLIDPDTRVCNDFRLDQTGQVVLITGSNMSGKSAFLRTLGSNLVLAQAGAVVCAQLLEVQPLRLYACIRINDSLAEGYSYFYAEVRRLRQILDALKADEAVPLFYLIDEIFKGTNNRERLQGSRAYIQALMGRHGMGLISTHDLELASIAGLLNYHFTDNISDDGLAFDYQLRPGVSPSTNALRIMAREGLPIE